MAGTGLEDAVQELAQAPLPLFVAERKRLADTLKAAGDAKGAKALLARKRPPVSAWVVNQLYWHARDGFDDLLATAEKIRKGDLEASAAHRDAIAKLRARAKRILEDAGHAAPEATLRRVTTTLSAIAVAGGFDPDPPGALADDRDPPGFAAFGLAGGDGAADTVADDAGADADDTTTKHDRKAKAHDGHAKAGQHAKHDKADHDDELAKARAKRDKERDREEREDARAREKAEGDAEKAREAAAAAQRAAEMAEKKREEAERKRVAAERHRLEAALRDAKAELHDRERDVKQLEKQLEKAHKDTERAQEIVDDLARKLDDLGDSH